MTNTLFSGVRLISAYVFISVYLIAYSVLIQDCECNIIVPFCNSLAKHWDSICLYGYHHRYPIEVGHIYPTVLVMMTDH